MTRGWQWLRAVWSRQTVRFRVVTQTTVVTLVCLLALAVGGSQLLGALLLGSVDDELHRALDIAVAEVRAGQPVPARPEGPTVRVLDTGGNPVDGRGPAALSAAEVHQLGGGAAVFRADPEAPVRLLGTVVTAPDGSQRLVTASGPLVGYGSMIRRGSLVTILAAVLASLAVAAATSVSVRWSLRPVQRMRIAAAGLPAGQRLPVPTANDEVRDLAEALNGLLDRRDEAAARLRRFTGDAAHELRSPVASIRVQAEVAVAHPDPELGEETLQAVAVEAERLSVLVDDLLALAKGDSDLAEAEPVDLVAAARSAADRIGERLDNHGISVRVDTPAPARIPATAAEVNLVLDNLLGNAVRYARARIRVAVLPAGRWVRLIVDDDGPGVPAEDRPHVFDRFYRVDDARGRGTGGAGLGLALVSETVRRRGGTVRVGDSPEDGARFEARWPSLLTSRTRE